MFLDHTLLALFFSSVAYVTIIIRSIFFLFTAYDPRSYASSYLLLFCSLCYNNHTLHLFLFHRLGFRNYPKTTRLLPMIGPPIPLPSWHFVRRMGPALSGALYVYILNCYMIRLSDGPFSSEFGAVG